MAITVKQKEKLLKLIADWIVMDEQLILRSQAHTVQVHLARSHGKKWQVQIYARESEDAASGFLNLADMRAEGGEHSWTDGFAAIRDFRTSTQIAILMKCLE